jgi:diadenosine tetraphosphatase ApaH/serine/threonine PP2A family protein phosphatase
MDSVEEEEVSDPEKPSEPEAPEGEPASTKILGLFQSAWEEDPVSGSVALSSSYDCPAIPIDLVRDILTECLPHLQQSKAIIDIPAPVVFVGDLHGSILDLIRIFQTFSVPPGTRYLFLGDYVDRGRNSVAVFCLILAFLCQYPDRVFLLRGNHEFQHINRVYGFFGDVLARYGDSQLWERFQVIFSWLPFAAIVDNSIFCVHGGLSPLLLTLQTLIDLQLPIETYIGTPLLSDLVWSDPNDGILGFQPNCRGSGQVFGADTVATFLKANNLKLLVRAHQCCFNGYRLFADNMGVTLFSSSNYCGVDNNRCGVMQLKDDREVSFFTLDHESDASPVPRLILLLAMDGDCGLKRVFRVNSRPDMRRRVSDVVEEGMDDVDQAFAQQLGMKRSQSFQEAMVLPD